MKTELMVGSPRRLVLAAGLLALAWPMSTPVHGAPADPAALAGPPPVPDQSYSLSLSPTAADAAPGADPDWKSRDYDSLYALLQKYRDELRLLRLKDRKTDAALRQIQEGNEDLAQKLESLHPLDGLKFHGDIVTYYDDVNINGPGAGPLLDGHFRTAVQRAELKLTYTRGIVNGMMEYDFQYLFGNQYDGPDYLGVEQVPVETGISQGSRQIYIELLTPVQIRLGTTSYRQTPLTVWREEDPDPFAPEIFSERRQRLRDDLLLEDDHAQVLQDALRLQTGDAGLFVPEFHFSALLTQLGTAPTNASYLTGSSPINVGADEIYATGTDTPTSLFETYDTYLAAGQLHYLFSSIGVDLGAQGTYTWDSPDSISRDYAVGVQDSSVVGTPVPGFSNAVYGLSLSLTRTSWVSLDAETDMSTFNAPAVAASGTDPQMPSDGEETGSATDIDLALHFGWLKIKGRVLDVSQYFTSSAAQNRTWDASMSPMGPFDTENSRFDPQSNGFGELMAPRAPETIYNRVILPAEYWYETPGGAVLASDAKMPYDPTVDSIDPYGDATPNRMRYGGGLEADLLKHAVQLGLDGDMATQIDKEVGQVGGVNENLPLETFERGVMGAHFNLKPLFGWALRGSGSYTVQSVRDSASVALDSGIIQGGLEQDLWQGATVELGYRHLDANGVLPYSNPAPFAAPDPALVSLGYESYDFSYDQWALGFTQAFTPNLVFTANYGDLAFTNALVGQTTDVTEARPNFVVQQGYARLTLDF
ncbi:MAG TPA: hypothetical protein VK914_07475 [bacterium]|jgi:hypothetical protein|nr:hypothetical protein [bacterium]